MWRLGGDRSRFALRKKRPLSGEIQLAYLGVGLARKPGPCMRKLLGADWKSAEGIVVRPRGRRRPGGNEQVRVAQNLQTSRSQDREPPYGGQPFVALGATQWLRSLRQREDLKLVLNRRMRTRMYGGVGGSRSNAGPIPIRIVMCRLSSLGNPW